MTDSVRLQILEHLVGLLEAAAPPDYDFTFSQVEIGPLSIADHKKRFTAGVSVGRETKASLFPLLDNTLPVTIEFRLTLDKNDPKPGVLAEKMLTQVQRIVYGDKTMGGLAMDTIETGNEVDIQTYADRSILGAVFFDVRYRHAHRDPRDANPTV